MVTRELIPVRHVIRGKVVEGTELEYSSRDLSMGFATPALDLNDLVWPRSEPFPLADTPMAEILAFLVETGRRLDLDRSETLREAYRRAHQVNPLGGQALEREYRFLATLFDRGMMEAEVEQALGDAYDHWKVVDRCDGVRMEVRAAPSRLVHLIAGNAPGVGATSIIRGALGRCVNLVKLPSNELFAMPAMLAIMAEIEPEHPVVRSFSAAYWRGGDTSVESALYRPQFFDKVVAWGGYESIAHIQKYLGPGLELISLDPKTSISVIGREAFASPETIRAVAVDAAHDVGSQEGCGNSRVQFVEASVDEADRFSEALLEELQRIAADAGGGRTTPEKIRADAEGLRMLEPDFRVWGKYDGTGLVIRSDEPVDFDLIARTVNVVVVGSITQAAQYTNVATQTVGIYPAHRKAEIRDALTSAGAQVIKTLGPHGVPSLGRPHDGFYPLHRMVRWVVDEG